ncbi:MAG: hypothetical protein GY859_33080 [Desulfobacterales bacterium]|nr:hypothetical protein [Desulfobacterales bacterium]
MKKTGWMFVVFVFVVWLASCGSEFSKKRRKADDLAEKINHVIARIREDLVHVTERSKEIFKNPSRYEAGVFPGRKYVFFNNIMYHNPEDDGNGVILYTGHVPVTGEEKKKVKMMEHLVLELKGLTEKSEFSDFIAQAYLITHDSMIVFYPFIDLAGYIPPGRDMQSRGGWKRASLKNNPGKKHGWAPPYVDTVGKGFMVDVSCPLYNGDFLEAFTGADITLKTIKEQFLTGVEEKILLIDNQSSQIFAMTDPCVKLLGVENIKAFKYLEMIENQEIEKSVMPDNLVLNRTTSPTMKALWRRLNAFSDFTIEIEKKERQVHAKEIPEAGWTLVLIE